MLQVMNAQQCVDSQLIVEAPALMSIVRPYSISLRTTARWPSEVSQADGELATRGDFLMVTDTCKVVRLAASLPWIVMHWGVHGATASRVGPELAFVPRRRYSLRTCPARTEQLGTRREILHPDFRETSVRSQVVADLRELE